MAGFFKFLWRFNAVLAFLALATTITFLTFFSKERIDRPLLNYIIPPPPAGVTKPLPSYGYVLEPNLVVGGNVGEEDFKLYRLMRWGKTKQDRAQNDGAAAVNILIVDRKTKKTSWVFKGFDRLIVSQTPMLLGRWAYDDYEASEVAPIHQIVMRVVEKDTNGDGYLTPDDRQTLYICHFNGTEPEKILSADQIWTAEQNGKSYVITYRDGDTAYIATYSVPDFKLVEQIKVDDMPK
jgi:hypothetical protein